MNIDTSTFTIPIGAGMTGVVYESARYNNLVLKKMPHRECKDAIHEFDVSKDIYSAYEQFYLCNNVTQIYIPRYLSLTQDPTSCSLLQEKILPTISNNGRSIWHIALSDAIVHKDREYNVSYSQDVSSTNSSRGFFASENSIMNYIDRYDSDIKTISDIVYRIGVLDGIIMFGAGYIPKDVEYVLSNRDNLPYVCAIDFGMVYPITEWSIDDARAYVSELDNSIYYVPVDEHAESFVDGLSTAYNCYRNPSRDAFYQNVVQEITNMI